MKARHTLMLAAFLWPLFASAQEAEPELYQGEELYHWSRDEGGNGHYYQLRKEPRGRGITWLDARDKAESYGGYLATINSAEEISFLNPIHYLRDDIVKNRYPANLLVRTAGYWLGGFKPAGKTEWTWINNEGPVRFFKWHHSYQGTWNMQIEVSKYGDHYLGFYAFPTDPPYALDCPANSWNYGYIVEYDYNPLHPEEAVADATNAGLFSTPAPDQSASAIESGSIIKPSPPRFAPPVLLPPPANPSPSVVIVHAPAAPAIPAFEDTFASPAPTPQETTPVNFAHSPSPPSYSLSQIFSPAPSHSPSATPAPTSLPPPAVSTLLAESSPAPASGPFSSPLLLCAVASLSGLFLWVLFAFAPLLLPRKFLRRPAASLKKR